MALPLITEFSQSGRPGALVTALVDSNPGIGVESNTTSRKMGTA